MALVKLNKAVAWDSAGVMEKPAHCKLCPMTAIGRAFVPDYVPDNPKIAFILDVPTKSDAIEQRPLSGSEGSFVYNSFVKPFGLQEEDVLVSHTIRCVQPFNGFGKVEYPHGWIQKPAELNCRHYDTGLLNFNPNVWVLTLHPRTIFSVGAHMRQIFRDIEKAVSFQRKGYRPAVLFGENAAELYYPYIKGNGGIKNWRSHFWTGESPFRDAERNEKSARRKLFVNGCK